MTHSSSRLTARVVAASCRAPRCTGESTAAATGLGGRNPLSVQRSVPVVASPVRSRFPRYRLEFADGSVLDVRGRGLIGRDPIAAADDTVEHLVALVDGTKSLSRTHLEF